MDTVSRQEVKNIFTELYGISAIGSVFDKYEWADICETTANELPSIQPERKKGEWIYQGKFSRAEVECDQCGKVFRNTFAPKNFCPNCGADMRGDKE